MKRKKKMHLANEIKVSTMTIYNWLNDPKRVSLKHCEKIDNALGVPHFTTHDVINGLFTIDELQEHINETNKTEPTTTPVTS